MSSTRPTSARARGFSLVELLVAMAIGLILTLAIASVMINSEGMKRSTTSLNDANQTGAYASYVLDRAIRSAGSGYAQRWQQAFGCRINASRDNNVMLPRPGPLPAPFDTVTTPIRLAPVLITKGAGATGSDVLAIMTGTAGFGESAAKVMPGSVSANGLRLQNTLGLRGNDLMLVVEDGVGCMMQQVQTGFTGSSNQQVTFAGRYYSQNGASVNLTTFGTVGQAYAVSLGNAANNAPMFQLFGVGPNNTLFTYDLLRIADDDVAVPIAEGVVQMRALYGVDTTGDGRQDMWADPAVAPFDSATLMDGSATSQRNLRGIVSVRLGLILRTSLVERGTVSPASITLFQDLPTALQQVRPITGDELRMRHRAVEVTIPLRNILLLPAV